MKKLCTKVFKKIKIMAKRGKAEKKENKTTKDIASSRNELQQFFSSNL